MNYELFFQASTAIQIHMIAAVSAFFLGLIVLWKKKGGPQHKLNGRIWVMLMMVTAFSGFFIHEIRLWGDYSPIHIFSIITPISLIYGIVAARKGDFTTHQHSMRGTFIGGMLFAGSITFLPGRLSNKIFLAEQDWTHLILAFVMFFTLGVISLIALRKSNFSQSKFSN